MQKQTELYRGKAKTLYKTNDPKILIAEFRDDTSAFDGEKTAKLSNKGKVNNYFNAFIMQHLANNGISTHFVEILNDIESAVLNLNMFPLECVIRNYAAGSLCRRLGITEGVELQPPIFEFFLKNDLLHDPMLNESHIQTFAWAKPEEVAELKTLTLKVNTILQKLFLAANLLLVDYKLEFGKIDHKIVLGDEFTPDGCRVWDANTKAKLDKDRFRQDLGDVVESYQQIATRLGIKIPA